MSLVLCAPSHTYVCAHLGELRHIQKLRFWPLQEVLHDKYLLPKDEADLIASFLTPMLRLVPEKRAKASELVHHAWLEGVVVQGELDVIRRAEEEDARRRHVEALELSSSTRRKEDAQAQTDADAMKPVEDAPAADAEVDEARSGAPVPSSSGAKENAPRAKEGAARARETADAAHLARGVPTLHTVPHPPRAADHKR